MEPAGLPRTDFPVRGRPERVRGAALSLGLGGALVVLCLPIRRGTQHVLTDRSLPGFTVAITVGLLVAAPLVLASAYVDVRPTFDVAARLQTAAPVGGVLVGQRTHDLIGDTVSLVATPQLHVKGKAEAVAAHLRQLPTPRPAGDRRSADSPGRGPR